MKPAVQPRTLLVIASTENWHEQFKGAALADGGAVVVEQCRWKQLHCETSSLGGRQRLVCFLS